MSSVSAHAAPAHQSQSLFARLGLLGHDIKLSHTVFAMPWALLATFLAARGMPRWGQLGLILLCMVTARTVAMAMNRLLDVRLDALNPRTARRALPSGALSRLFVVATVGICAIAFVLATGGFYWFYGNPWPLILTVPVLAFISAYPLLKRFTRLCHYYLGGALALAPVCAYLAIAGTLAWAPVVMAGAVLTWTAGFDIIYACQDYASDLATGTFSVPAKVGIAGSLWIARLTHAASAGLLILLGVITPQFGVLYFIGVGVAIVLLVAEHAVVSPRDLSKVGLAFFTLNGIISLLVGTLGVIDTFR